MNKFATRSWRKIRCNNFIFRQKLRRIQSESFTENIVGFVIFCNAIVIGLGAFPRTSSLFGYPTESISDVFGFLYLIELVMRWYSTGFTRYFINPFHSEKGFWNWFDFLVVAISFAPNILVMFNLNYNAAVIRTLRLVRIFKVITHSEKAKKVIGGFVYALPSMGTVILLMLLILFVSGVIATDNFGASSPDKFGNLAKSMYSLFQVMTLEGWSGDFARPLSIGHPWAKTFFVIFILMTTFAVLNLLVALIVNSMQEANKKLVEKEEGFENMVLKRLEEIDRKLETMQQ